MLIKVYFIIFNKKFIWNELLLIFFSAGYVSISDYSFSTRKSVHLNVIDAFTFH